jgi:hypothetical protein
MTTPLRICEAGTVRRKGDASLYPFKARRFSFGKAGAAQRRPMRSLPARAPPKDLIRLAPTRDPPSPEGKGQ